MFYSVEAKQKISQLLDDFKPDIAHLHSIYHHLSSSIIFELKKRNIPIVQTLHDYHLVSPNHTLFHDGKICEVTKPNKYYKAIFHRCVKESYWASLAEVAEQYLHLLTGAYAKNIDLFIAPSKFFAQKIKEYGIPAEKIVVLHNFCNSIKFKPNYKFGDYILYFGRLSPEKGLKFLIEAMSCLPEIQLKIIGEGLEEDELKQQVKKIGARNVQFLGYKSGQELKNLLSGSRFIVLPSQCYENFPTSIMEAFSCGKPVVASNIGGIPELVKDGYDGFLFKMGDQDDCIAKIKKLWYDFSLCRKLGQNAREYVEKNFGPEEHYSRLIEIYRKIIKLYSVTGR